MKLEAGRHRCFDDVANYLTCFVSLALLAELYVRGSAAKYGGDHVVVITGKQASVTLTFYPAPLLNGFVAADPPDALEIDVATVDVPDDAQLHLGPFERPVHVLGQGMFTGFYEREVEHIFKRYGNDRWSWPEAWNFGRVIRNAVSHDGQVNLESSKGSVSWRGLTYGPEDYGRVVWQDLWPGDLVVLMLDMDAQLRSPDPNCTQHVHRRLRR